VTAQTQTTSSFLRSLSFSITIYPWSLALPPYCPQ
jgi:hypothetical protein